MAAQHLFHPSYERRIPLQLLAYWEKMRKGRPMPLESDIDMEDLHDFWDNCFLLHVKDIPPENYRYSYVGSGIIEAYGGNAGERDGEAAVTPQPGMIDAYHTVMYTRKPLVVNGEFTSRHNQLVKYRQCLLPLGEGDEVHAILGALHIRVFP